VTVEAIKQAIEELPAEAKTRLAAWLLKQDMAGWDRQIEEDFSPGGRGMALLKEAQAEIRAGRLRPLDELLAEVKARRKSLSRRSR